MEHAPITSAPKQNFNNCLIRIVQLKETLILETLTN
jgi:hypothetical protein